MNLFRAYSSQIHAHPRFVKHICSKLVITPTRACHSPSPSTVLQICLHYPVAKMRFVCIPPVRHRTANFSFTWQLQAETAYTPTRLFGHTFKNLQSLLFALIFVVDTAP